MSSIPALALKFGALSVNEAPISYGKARVSGGKSFFSYILHSKAGCMPGQPEIFTPSSLNPPSFEDPIRENQITRAFKRHACESMKIPIGPRNSGNCPYGFTFDKYSPHDDETLDLAKRTAYRQIYGNFHPMESEQSTDLERRLRNGDINIQEFIRGLAKSSFYKQHYFHAVNQQRSIELSFKHILGRPPASQEEIVKHVQLLEDEGFERHIDALVDSAEYQETFGKHTVPYIRCWNSPCGTKTSSFVNAAELIRSFASSDNAIHKRKTLSDDPGGKGLLVRQLAEGKTKDIRFPEHVSYSTNLEAKGKEI